MAQKRMSQSFMEESVRIPESVSVPPSDSEGWIKTWHDVHARDLIDSRIVSVDAETSVEDACDVLLSEDILCLAIKSQDADSANASYVGLFDFSDVNAFLTLAATRHTLLPEDLFENLRVNQIVTAALAGRVPVKLVSDLSEKNPLEIVPYDANIISLLKVFARGTHRVLVQSPSPSTDYEGMVSDRGLLSWFSSFALHSPSFQRFLSNSLQSLSIPSLDISTFVVSETSNSTVLSAMKLMSEQGVSSIAVLDEQSGSLLSAVSVTDVGKVVVPSQSNQILSQSLSWFIARIKEPDGSTDGVDKFPVYSVQPTSALSYTIQKILATNAHRLFVTKDSGSTSPAISPTFPGAALSGIVSVVDILSIFARIANIPDVDPTRMQRHRRASSASSHSSKSDRSRSSSRTGLNRSPIARTSTGPLPSSDSARDSISSLDSWQWSERLAKKEA